jgi:hypothetical protein
VYFLQIEACSLGGLLQKPVVVEEGVTFIDKSMHRVFESADFVVLPIASRAHAHPFTSCYPILFRILAAGARTGPRRALARGRTLPVTEKRGDCRLYIAGPLQAA